VEAWYVKLDDVDGWEGEERVAKEEGVERWDTVDSGAVEEIVGAGVGALREERRNKGGSSCEERVISQEEGEKERNANHERRQAHKSSDLREGREGGSIQAKDRGDGSKRTGIVINEAVLELLPHLGRPSLQQMVKGPPCSKRCPRKRSDPLELIGHFPPHTCAPLQRPRKQVLLTTGLQSQSVQEAYGRVAFDEEEVL
jgi:hypothetical protein